MCRPRHCSQCGELPQTGVRLRPFRPRAVYPQANRHCHASPTPVKEVIWSRRMESLTGIGTTRNPALARWLAGLAAGAILWLTACSQLDAFADALSAVPLFIGFLAAGVPLGVTFSFLISAPLVNEVALVLLAEKGAQADVDRHLRRGRRQRHPAGRLRLQLAAVMRLPIRRRFRLAASGACLRLICVLVLATASSLLTAAASPSSPSSSTASFPWIEANAAGERQVHLYFFWTSTCTHCQAARPFVEALPARHPWLVLHSRNLTTDPNAADAYVAMAESLGQEASSVPALTLGTIALAIAANSNELLCAPGFPMIYTRLLTLSELPPWQHYAYLAFYNVVYVIPLLVITVVFTYTLGSRKLSEIEGRLLKLVSGTMMLGLGILLIAAPAVLNDLRVALVLLVGSIGLSWLVHWLRKPVQGAKNE